MIIPISNSWSCLPASFSMACDVSFKYFIDKLGHDGNSRPYSNKSLKRGFSFQECIDVAWKLGFTCTPIERYPALIHSYGSKEICKVYTEEIGLARFMQYMSTTKRGILEGIRIRTDGSKVGHACAWDGKLIYDPSHRTYKFEDSIKNNFYITVLWILMEVKYGKSKKLDI